MGDQNLPPLPFCEADNTATSAYPSHALELLFQRKYQTQLSPKNDRKLVGVRHEGTGQ